MPDTDPSADTAAHHSYRPDDLADWLALIHTPGIGPVTCLRLLEHFPAPADLLRAESRQLRALAIPERLIEGLGQPDWRAVDRDLAWLSANDSRHILTLPDPDYPALLKEIPDAPPVLYVLGDVTTLSQPQIAVVGSRNPSASGEQHAQEFAAALCEAGATISSGLALGIDACAHRGALQSGGRTIAVMGNGLDTVYPARNRELARRIVTQGALVSEFSPGTTPRREHFPRRNRIISGLSLGTLVIEAARRSGSLITARLAAEQGREVFALPGSIYNPLAKGCHELIRQGAKLVESIEHILEEIGQLAVFMAQASQANENHSELSESQQNLLQHMGYEPCPVDVLIERSGLTADVVSSMLLTLELQGIIESMPGGSYSRRQ